MRACQRYIRVCSLQNLYLCLQTQVEKEVLQGHSNDELVITGAPTLEMEFPEVARIKLLEVEA